MYGQWGPWGPWGPYYGYGWYGPWGPYGYGYGWGMPYGYPYGYSYYNATGFVSSLKIQATNKAFKDAEVYVDGAPAGTVEDFDGLFQSLHVKPGSREIVLYKEGFRSARQAIYIRRSTKRNSSSLLSPSAKANRRIRARRYLLQAPSRILREETTRTGRYARLHADQAPAPEPQPQTQPQREADARFGTLSVRVQPVDAEILIDGERWTASAQPDRLSLKLAAGRHKLEVRKEGFVTYTEDVLIRDQATMTLNIVLTRK